ncbi:MAG TPA: UDP-N-acetylglucosamine--N-acetylmuramyl-(pentapeptide) pyrophosphoryl-undecaprenol N-acetylglucosamine transferase [Tissierellia bacterium]|jgi:UDP-N-acetylglucosamine--N-acetylmuramyl-(pentapeptide) pyrophosphoryl-undecaprenol N-acetylglucosamine transferase|nr:UDP-N-acetylglucosamine--N-acetylmuramyl-(pentapeptide) pyrophosphoryl-undecaprenol N-acetylglucosamine transferase [Tissierellia bacterium]
MKVLISCGGTGGHIFPAVAIAEALRELRPDIKLYLAGLENSMEEEAAKKADIEFVPTKARMFSGFFLRSKIRSVWTLLREALRMRRWYRSVQPDLLISTGGFVTGAPILGAILSKTPFFLHEQNVFPGLANRLFASRARKIFISYEESKKYLKAKEDAFVLSGNPVRSIFFTLDREAIRKKRGWEGKTVLLSSGGSIGSDSFNDLVSDASIILQKHPDLEWIHTSGPDVDQKILEKYQKTPRLHVYPFIEEMPELVTAADLVLSRAGAITLSENAFTGRAALLLPSPYVASDHQKANAASFDAHAAAKVFPDADLYDPQTRKEIFDSLEELLQDGALREQMGRNARALSRADAAALIAKTCLKEVGE